MRCVTALVNDGDVLAEGVEVDPVGDVLCSARAGEAPHTAVQRCEAQVVDHTGVAVRQNSRARRALRQRFELVSREPVEEVEGVWARYPEPSAIAAVGETGAFRKCGEGYSIDAHSVSITGQDKRGRMGGGEARRRTRCRSRTPSWRWGC